MSEFAVDVRTIESVEPHPNADRLDICKVSGLEFQFVTGKGLNEIGDEVVYFPIDAVLPDPLLEFLELLGKLSGKARNKVKTIKLRGEISQGVVANVSKLIDAGFLVNRPALGENVAELLSVTKYEPEIIYTSSGALLPLPSGVESYDIEGCERNKHIVQYLIDNNIPVVITEKLEGTNASTTVTSGGAYYVCSHNHALEEGDNLYWRVAKESGMLLATELFLQRRYSSKERVTLRGEIIGPSIQNNIYKLEKPTVRLFDLKVDGKYVDYTLFSHFLHQLWIAYKQQLPGRDEWLVPVLAENILLQDWLGNRTIQEASNGYSLLNPEVLREGIVIRPMKEMDVHRFGRLIIKQRSPEYLASEK